MSKKDIELAEWALKAAAQTAGYQDATRLFRLSVAQSLVAIAKSLESMDDVMRNPVPVAKPRMGLGLGD